MIWPSAVYFNSRPYARGDPRDGTKNLIPMISIHAPTRGATHHLRNRRGYWCHFNSRPYARGDSTINNCVADQMISIHAPTRGATAVGWLFLCAWCNFNSRPYARGDAMILSRLFISQISIHAPTRGATGGHSADGCQARISIHAPTRGATRTTRSFLQSARYFNSRPYARGDPAPLAASWQRTFQFTPLREGRRLGISLGLSYLLDFNSRPYARGDGCWKSESRIQRDFNSRPYARGDASETVSHQADLFQFTPLREGRPLNTDAETQIIISIHAPTRGATH